jgi:RNA-binding protein
LLAEIDQALETNELIKVKFSDYKEKEQKNALTSEIAQHTRSHIAGMIGHVAILYRQNKDKEKQQIRIDKTP